MSLTGLEAVVLFAIILAILFKSKARMVIPTVIAAAALLGGVSIAIRG